MNARFSVLCLLCAAISGCGPSHNQPFVPVPPANARPAMSSSAHPMLMSASLQSGSVFISTFQAPSNVINLYVPASANPVRTITHGFTVPGHLALDPLGNLYSGNGDPRDITVYAPGSSSVMRTITPRLNGGGWFVMGVDVSARLYALSYWSQCRFQCLPYSQYAVYSAGATTPLRTLSFGPTSRNSQPPESIAFDRAQDVYVGNAGWIDVYSAGLATKLREITLRYGSAPALAFDSLGVLYVDHGNAVSEYAGGGTSLLRLIRSGVFESQAIALDRFNNLYVANGPPNGSTGSVTIYRAGTTSLVRKIRTGIVNPVGLAFDRSGNLYVLNRELGTTFNGSVAIYAPGGSVPVRTLRARTCCPFEMVVQP